MRKKGGNSKVLLSLLILTGILYVWEITKYNNLDKIVQAEVVKNESRFETRIYDLERRYENSETRLTNIEDRDLKIEAARLKKGALK